MKKIFLLMFLSFLLVSCGNVDDSNSNKGDSLETPVLEFDSNTNTVSWDSVDGAEYYNYIINDEDILSTTETSIEIRNEETISVQAANDSFVSAWSYAVTSFDTSDIVVNETEYIYVKFHNSKLTTKKIKSGDKIKEPSAPKKENYIFDNWYKDPYYEEVFDFSEQLYENTIVYAHYLPTELVDDVYFWIKGDNKMSAEVMSSGTSSDWHFIPLKVNDNNHYKEFEATVTVTGASATKPCEFIVMDGFSNDSGRTYWKNGEANFSIASDGVYTIYFSLENQYQQGIHVSYKKGSVTALSSNFKFKNLTLKRPVVSVDSKNNLAFWDSVDTALSYEVIIDNNEVIKTEETSITLEKGSHITVRALNGDKYSHWSLPKANRGYDFLINDMCSVYFYGYDAYNVAVNTKIEAPDDLEKENFTFCGWYLDIACTKKAKFPYEVVENTVFYPKWTSNDDYQNTIYYNLVTDDGSVVGGLKWNLDNYTFDEYESEVLNLESGTNYYIEDTKNNKKYGPYTVEKDGRYNIYFSLDNSWNGENIYFSSVVKTIYFSSPVTWTDTIYVYVWNSTTDDFMSNWPGLEMAYVETNGMGQKIYSIDIDTSLYDSIIFTHGSNGVATGSQTVDISLKDNPSNGFYLTEKNSEGKYGFGTYSR